MGVGVFIRAQRPARSSVTTQASEGLLAGTLVSHEPGTCEAAMRLG